MKNIIKKRIVGLPNADWEIDYSELPKFTAKDYLERIDRLFKQTQHRYTHFVIYGDREHCSNMEYFSGYDPRFEESILILAENGKHTLIIGVEGSTYAAKIPYEYQLEVYPPFSIPCYSNQMKCTTDDATTSLEYLFGKAGLNGESYVGVLGWKLMGKDEFDLPMFIYEALCETVPRAKIENANAHMIDNAIGMRHTLEVKELILTEIAGTKASKAVYDVFSNLKEGISELEASRYLCIDGDPLNMHPNVNFGKNVFWGLASPDAHTKLEDGDLVSVGIGFRRSVCFKIGRYASAENVMNTQMEFYFNLYFRSLAAWYESLRIGSTGGQVFENIEKEIGDVAEFGIGINTGHLIHTDEWTNSPFYKNCDVVLHSGMAIQSDYSAYRPDLGVALHEEDGVILMDEQTAKEYRLLAPKSFERMLNRRRFMRETLGIQIGEEVYPVSDNAGVMYPFLKNMNIVLSNA